MGNNPPITISNLALSDSTVDSAVSYYSIYKNLLFPSLPVISYTFSLSSTVSNIHLRYSIRCYSVLCCTMLCYTSLFYAVPMILRAYVHVYYHPVLFNKSHYITILYHKFTITNIKSQHTHNILSNITQ